MPTVVLSLGSNLGNRLATIKSMLKALEPVMAQPLVVSPYMETAPVEVSGSQPWYLNVLIKSVYRGTAQKLLKQCQDIENKLGRTDKGKRLPRTADIDILLFGSVLSAQPHLTIPHPRMLKRRFCLEGLYFLVPESIIPGTGKSVAMFYKSMNRSLKSQKFNLID